MDLNARRSTEVPSGTAAILLAVGDDPYAEWLTLYHDAGGEGLTRLPLPVGPASLAVDGSSGPPELGRVRFQRDTSAASNRIQAAWIAWVNSLLFSILFYVSTHYQPLEIFVEYPIFLVFTLPLRTQVFVYIASVCMALTIIMAIFTILAWKGKQCLLAERIYYSIATLAAAGYILFLTNWGLIAALF